MITISKISANDAISSTITFLASSEVPSPNPEIKVETFPIVGWYLWLNGRHINLLQVDPFSNMERWVDSNTLHALKHIVKYQLTAMKNWGFDEQDYEKAVISEDLRVRGLVAKNGKFLAELSKDSDPSVRLKTIEYLIDNKDARANMNTDWLGVMVNDKDVAVRSMLAKLGMVEFNDVLVNDPSVLVRGQVAKHGNEHHREQLKGDVNNYIQSMLS